MHLIEKYIVVTTIKLYDGSHVVVGYKDFKVNELFVKLKENESNFSIAIKIILKNFLF